jgi:anti-anti-sigma factor
VSRLTVALKIRRQNFLKLSGELDVSTSNVLSTKVVGVVHGPVLVDCDQLRFVDSHGFAALAALCEHSDSVVLWRPASEVRDVCTS